MALPATPVTIVGSTPGTPGVSATTPVYTLNAALATPWQYAAAAGGILNSNTAVTTKTAAGAGVRNYVQSLQITWEALGTATEVAIRDGASGTVMYRIKLPSGSAGTHTPYFGIPLRGTANTLIEVVALTATVTGAVYVNMQGFTGA